MKETSEAGNKYLLVVWARLRSYYSKFLLALPTSPKKDDSCDKEVAQEFSHVRDAIVSLQPPEKNYHSQGMMDDIIIPLNFAVGFKCLLITDQWNPP